MSPTNDDQRIPRRIRFQHQAESLLLQLSITAVLLLSACSNQSGDNTLQIKSPGTGAKNEQVKSGYAYPITKSFTDPSGKLSTASNFRTYVANYDLNATNFALTLDRPLTAEDQVRVVFSLVGAEGTNDKSAVTAGTYSAKADKFMKVDDVSIVSKKGNQDSKQTLDRGGLTGQVKLTSVSADQITGDIDLTSGDDSIKGSFTAKILKRK